MIYRNIKVPLNLSRMQIHRDNPVYACDTEKICRQLRCNRVSRLRFSVLSGVAVIRNHRIDSGSGRSLHRVHHDEEFHEIVICRIAGRLDDIDILAADTFPEAHGNLAVAEFAYRRLAQRLAHNRGDFLCQFRI